MRDGKKTFGWDLCYTCNYRCPYCGVWQKRSEGDLLLHAEAWGKIWDRLFDKYGHCHIFMSGGEPATYPFFYELVRRLTQRHSVEICTNLSWDVSCLVPDTSSEVLKIAPTFHPTFAKFEDFFEKVNIIKEYLPNSQVYYVAHPGQIKEMPERSRRFKELCVNLIPLPLRGDGFVLNSEDEKKIVAEVSPYKGEKIEYQLQRISPLGKLCRTGQHYAVVRANGVVDRCSQYSNGLLGNLLDEDFELFSGPSSCVRDYCPIESQWIVKDE